MKTLNEQVTAVFAASGAIASGVARRWAEEGALVVVSARDSARVETVVQSIRAAGGRAEGAVVDATDDAAVGAHLDRLVKQHGRLDAVFNGIGGTPADLKYPASSRTQTLADFLVPLDRIVGSQFLTARHAARVMAPRQRGAIVLLSATLSGMPATHMAGISAACGAIEALGRALAGEFGPEGIRVNCVRGSAMPETRTIQLTGAGLAPLGLTPQMVPPPMRRPITVDETAKVAAFLASDASSGMTGQVVTVCGGAFV